MGKGRTATQHPINRARVWNLHTPFQAHPYVRVQCDTCDTYSDLNCMVNTPPHFIANKMRSKGWKIKGEGKAATCPACRSAPPKKAPEPPKPHVDRTRARVVVVDPAPPPPLPEYARPVTLPVLDKERAQALAKDIDKEVASNKKPKSHVTRVRLHDLACTLVIERVAMPGWNQSRIVKETGLAAATVSRLSRREPVSRQRTLDKVVKAMRSLSKTAKEPSMSTVIQSPAKSRAALKVQRQVFALLEDHFDDEKGVYRDDWSDARIAKETGLAAKAVASTRETAFGSLNNMKYVAIEQKLALIERKLVKEREELSKLFTSTLQDINRELSAARKELAELKAGA